MIILCFFYNKIFYTGLPNIFGMRIGSRPWTLVIDIPEPILFGYKDLIIVGLV
jgi:hypothetical protein